MSHNVMDRHASDGSNLRGGLVIDLGGTAVEVRSDDPRWLDACRGRYGAFVRPSSRIDLRVRHSDNEPEMRDRHQCLSHIEPGGRTAEMASAAGTDVLDGVLRTMLPRAAVPDLIVHGGLLADGDRGMVFCGRSGTGKSTMAALFPDRALCDELVRLTVRPRVEARSLPFWTSRPGSADVASVFILEHGAEHVRTPLDRGRALREMRRHVYWPVDDAQAMTAAFEALAEVCRRVPVYRLAFRPETSVWDVMRGV